MAAEWRNKTENPVEKGRPSTVSNGGLEPTPEIRVSHPLVASVDSFIRPNKLFTADKNIILSTAGHLSEDKTRDVVNTIIKIISA
jgi:hypothetical protein